MAGILLIGAAVWVSSLQPANAHQARVTCPCDCPAYYKDGHRAGAHAAAQPFVKRAAPRPVMRRIARHYGGSGYYSYRMAAPVMRRWHDEWRVAPNDAFIPGPAPMGPPMAYYPPPPPPEYGMRIDDRGLTGGVGDVSGGDGGGYGQLHFGNGGSVENGPTYNSYDQSFQYNPSQAGPFQNRLMGGFAPATKK